MASNNSSINPTISAVSKTRDGFGATCINVVSTTYRWTVYNFTACDEEVGNFLVSPTFRGGPNESLVWQLQLYPYNKTSELKDYLSIHLHLIRADKERLRAKWEFSLMNSLNKEVTLATSARYKVIIHRNEGSAWCWEEKKFILRSNLTNPSTRLLPNDNLTIVVKISVALNAVNIPGKKHTIILPKTQILEDYSALYESKKHSDMTLVTAKGQKFPAHKAILAARSGVFSAMFADHEVAGKVLNSVEIPNIDGETIEAMLKFVYFDETNDVDKMAAKLLVAANQYNLGRLKDLCEDTLCESISRKNAVQLWCLGRANNAERLKQQAHVVITARKIDLIGSHEYKSLMRDLDQKRLEINTVQPTPTLQIGDNSSRATTAPPATPATPAAPEPPRTRGRKRKTESLQRTEPEL